MHVMALADGNEVVFFYTVSLAFIVSGKDIDEDCCRKPSGLAQVCELRLLTLCRAEDGPGIPVLDEPSDFLRSLGLVAALNAEVRPAAGSIYGPSIDATKSTECVSGNTELVERVRRL